MGVARGNARSGTLPRIYAGSCRTTVQSDPGAEVIESEPPGRRPAAGYDPSAQSPSRTWLSDTANGMTPAGRP